MFPREMHCIFADAGSRESADTVVLTVWRCLACGCPPFPALALELDRDPVAGPATLELGLQGNLLKGIAWKEGSERAPGA